MSKLYPPYVESTIPAQMDGGRREGIYSCWTSIMKKAFFFSFNVCDNPPFQIMPILSHMKQLQIKVKWFVWSHQLQACSN